VTGSNLGGFPLGGNTTSPPAPRPRQLRSWCSTLRFCGKTVPKPAPIAKKYRSYGRRAQILRLHAARILCGRWLRYLCEGTAAIRRARHRSSGSRRRGSTAGQFRAAAGARWRVALSSQRHYAGPRPSCVGTRPSGMSRRARRATTPSRSAMSFSRRERQFRARSGRSPTAWRMGQIDPLLPLPVGSRYGRSAHRSRHLQAWNFQER
jgi:hypothetical protein